MREAAGVQRQAQRERRTVVALLPGMAAAGQRLPVRRALAARAGPVEQGDGGLQVEQVGGALWTGQAQLLEQGRQTELPHGPQGDVLDADRARADQLQAADVDPRQGDVAAEVAQGALAHPGAAADEAVGEVGLLALGAGASGGLADEQAPMGAGPGTGVRELQVVVALHLGFQGGWPLKTNDLQRKTRRIRPKSLLA